MVHFVGAGSGATDLITERGAKLLSSADVIIYAGSLVNTEHLKRAKADTKIYDSAKMTLEEVIDVIKGAEANHLTTVRLHTGDPCLYGAIREQMDLLSEAGIDYDYCPGVSSFSGAASALLAEYTLPSVSQSVVITRTAGKTPVPEKESIQSFAAHNCTMVIFLSTGHLEKLSQELMEGGYGPDDAAAIVYKATWPDQKVVRCTVSTLAQSAKENHITKTALILVGGFLDQTYDRSMLYHPEFETEFRAATSSHSSHAVQGQHETSRYHVPDHEDEDYDTPARSEYEKLPPMEIEHTSFSIITKELEETYPNLKFTEEELPILKRIIHTTADFTFAESIYFSKDAIESAKNAITKGARIITDTNMAKSGINKKAAAKFGIDVECFVADPEVAKMAKDSGMTRSTISMQRAAELYGKEERPTIFVIGNAPTALLALEELIKEKKINPALVVAAPVGFVNVVESKEIIVDTGVPCIATMGRRGGSNVAASIINAIMYMAGGRNE